MTDIDQASYLAGAPRDAPSAWAGGVVFADILMITMGAYVPVVDALTAHGRELRP
jgi:hypothetical protein